MGLLIGPSDEQSSTLRYVNAAHINAAHVQEFRAKRNEEKLEKEKTREVALRANKDQLMKTKGFQRLLASEYDRKLKEARLKGRKNFNNNERIDGGPIMSARDPEAAKSGAFDLRHFLAEQQQGEQDFDSSAGAHAHPT